jgi:hypothetical protein
LALTRQAKRGITVSAETVRRGLHELDWGWKRATLVAQDDDPHRGERLARSRLVYERLPRWEAMVFAAALESHVRPTVGYAWMPQGPQVEVMTPGTHEQPSLAGALDLATGTLRYGRGPRNPHGRFRELRPRVDDAYPAPQCQRVDGVVDNDNIHQAKAVDQGLANHPRVARLLWPTSCPRANPIERAFGDVHDLCTRKHTRKRLRDLGADVDAPRHMHGPWHDERSELSSAPAVTATVEHIAAEEHAKVAA